ncbi:hypothetical protein EVAR_88621_1 [Eumeta japonica]|uniref:Uncharacterized protein n=1 Tax=Eumeta variegata TaxID=151549 RepID=A0A4C1X1Z7_EUMVA|nr:hypothetical protein EVAR_88621_1 [Eumeta japonica]
MYTTTFLYIHEYNARNPPALNCQRTMQCAGSTLPDNRHGPAVLHRLLEEVRGRPIKKIKLHLSAYRRPPDDTVGTPFKGRARCGRPPSGLRSPIARAVGRRSRHEVSFSTPLDESTTSS